ncbi:MAG: DUF4058 family protein [Planctomycetota bacterium]
MRSPFPGMDSYLESHWRDIHARMIIHAAERLQERLPKDLRARVEERVLVEPTLGAERGVYPDVRAVERLEPRVEPAPSAGETTVAQPLVIHVDDEPATQCFIEIREAGTGHPVITVIEILSLANKVPGEGQDLYRQKQRELKEGKVNLVEIDLLRAGRRVLSIPPELIPVSHRTPYQICIRRSMRPTAVEVYRVPLRERLPVIPIPLRETDRDGPLDFQAILDHCYSTGAYDDIDYTVEPDPPLDSSDAAWADALLREKGLR